MIGIIPRPGKPVVATILKPLAVKDKSPERVSFNLYVDTHFLDIEMRQ